MAPSNFGRLINSWRPEERLAEARKCVEELTYRIQEVLELSAASDIICYSDRLSKQIPPSRAAIAYNNFSKAIFDQFLIKLLAIWDRADDNSISIPKAILLINDDRVIDLISAETLAAHRGAGVRVLNLPVDEHERKFVLNAMDEEQHHFAQSQAEKAVADLQLAIGNASEIVSGDRQIGLRNFRDKASHSLTFTRSEKRGKVVVMKYGHEKELLAETIDFIECLYCWVNGVGFDIAGECRSIAEKSALELWGSCIFDIGDN